MPQPFLKVTTTGGTVVIINENQVVSVEKAKASNAAARIAMSNGDVYVIEKPSYEEWENDCLVRKN